MKRKDLLLLTFLLSQTTPVWAMNHETFDHSVISSKSKTKKSQHSALQVERIKEDLLNVIRITKIKAEQYKGLEQVIVMGTTGSGKSTVINLLAGKNLVAQRGKFDTTDPVPGSEIGHDYSSKTTLLSPWKGPDGRVYWDGPGSKDSKGAKQEIVNTAIREIFSGKVKILFTVKEKDLEDRALEFLTLLNNATKIFSVEELEKNAAVIITKQGRDEDMVAHEELQKMLQILPGSDNALFTPEVHSFLSHLVENKERLVPYFPAPQKGVCDLETPRKAIFATVDHLNYVENPKVHSLISLAAKDLIMQLAKDLNGDVTDAIETILSPKVLELCEPYTNASASNDSLPGLGHNLRALQQSLNLLEKDSVEEMEGFTHPLDHFFGQEDNVVKEYIQTLSFLRKLTNEVTVAKDTWSRALHSILTDIHGSIDTLAEELGNVISSHLGASISHKIIEFSSSVLGSTSSEETTKLNSLKEGLNTIQGALHCLYYGRGESMMKFAHSFNTFFENPQENPLVEPMRKVTFLQTLKEDITHPMEDYVAALQPTLLHLQTLIESQERLLEEKRERADREEARRQLMDQLGKQADRHAEAQAALIQQLEHNNRLTEELRYDLKVEQNLRTEEAHLAKEKQAEDMQRLEEDLTAKLQYLETTAAADRQVLLNEINQREQENAHQADTIRTLEAHVSDELQVAAKQLAEAQQYAAQEHQKLVNLQIAIEEERILREKRQEILTLKSGTPISPTQFNILAPHQRTTTRVVKVNGRQITEHGFFRK